MGRELRTGQGLGEKEIGWGKEETFIRLLDRFSAPPEREGEK